MKKVVCTDIDGKEYEVSVSELSFRPSVYSVICKDNKILMSKQFDGYEFPGGGVDIGEQLEEALARETKEETGLNIEVNDILHVESTLFKLPFKGNYVQTIRLYYKCKVISGKISTEYYSEQEKVYANEPEWLSLEELPNTRIHGLKRLDKLIDKLKKFN